jgi:hypothetical protein
VQRAEAAERHELARFNVAHRVLLQADDSPGVWVSFYGHAAQWALGYACRRLYEASLREMAFWLDFTALAASHAVALSNNVDPLAGTKVIGGFLADLEWIQRYVQRSNLPVGHDNLDFRNVSVKWDERCTGIVPVSFFSRPTWRGRLPWAAASKLLECVEPGDWSELPHGIHEAVDSVPPTVVEELGKFPPSGFDMARVTLREPRAALGSDLHIACPRCGAKPAPAATDPTELSHYVLCSDPACLTPLVAFPISVPLPSPSLPPKSLAQGATLLFANRERGPTLPSQYANVVRIRQGGQGTVYRADDLTLGHAVAIKALSQGRKSSIAELKNLEREAEILKDLDHPNIVKLIRVHHERGLAFLVLEWVEGKNLGDILDSGIPTTEVTLAVFEQIARALAYAHDRGLLHRDISPGNILVGTGNVAKLTDFGLSRGSGLHSLTGSHNVMGTRGYLAPEVLTHLAYSTQSDVFAFGACLYKALTGRIMSLDETTSPLRDLPVHDPLRTFLERCVANDRERRFPNASALADALETILALDRPRTRL